MTPSQRKTFFRQFSKQYEKQIRISERVSYRIAQRIYLDAFIEGSKLYMSDRSFNALDLVDVLKFRQLYIDIYRDTGLRFAKWYRRMFEKVATKLSDPTYDLWDAIFTQYGETQAGRLVTTVNETMKESFLSKISRQFADPEFAALGAQQQAAILYSDKFWAKQSRWMALRVARTENNTAANLAIKEASLSLFPADQLMKVWDTSEDERVRDTHVIAGRQDPIGLNDWYNVGAVRMRWPNDPEAIGMSKEVARERINCRCRMVTFPKEEVFDDLYDQIALMNR